MALPRDGATALAEAVDGLDPLANSALLDGLLAGDGPARVPVSEAAMSIAEFEATHAWSGVTTLVLHPQVSGRPTRWHLLCDVLRHFRTKNDVWIATGAEIARHYEACKARAAAVSR